jgi:hypothetical protein
MLILLITVLSVLGFVAIMVIDAKLDLRSEGKEMRKALREGGIPKYGIAFEALGIFPSDIDLEKGLGPPDRFAGQDLEGADLERAYLVGHDLSDTNLKNANLRGAILILADFDGTNFEGADLEGARLWRPSGDSRDYGLMREAIYDEHTIWPIDDWATIWPMDDPPWPPSNQPSPNSETKAKDVFERFKKCVEECDIYLALDGEEVELTTEAAFPQVATALIAYPMEDEVDEFDVTILLLCLGAEFQFVHEDGEEQGVTTIGAVYDLLLNHL